VLRRSIKRRVSPEESLKQRYEEAMALYRWFMPLLHLDARPDLVQCIKLCEELLGRGSANKLPSRHGLRCIHIDSCAQRPTSGSVGRVASACSTILSGFV
jgi:hypothetical protein